MAYSRRTGRECNSMQRGVKSFILQEWYGTIHRYDMRLSKSAAVQKSNAKKDLDISVHLMQINVVQQCCDGKKKKKKKYHRKEY